MRQHGGQVDQSGVAVDRRGLHGGDLVLAQGLAHDVETTGQRCIAPLPSPGRPLRIVAVGEGAEASVTGWCDGEHRLRTQVGAASAFASAPSASFAVTDAFFVGSSA